MKLYTRILTLAMTTMALAYSARAQVKATLLVDVPTQPLKAGDKLTAKLTVDIDPGWHIYSLTQPDGGPIRSELRLSSGQSFKLTDKIVAPNPDVQYSEALGINLECYQGEVVFTLPLVATAPSGSGAKLKLEFTYQACTEENCHLPQTDILEAPVNDSAPTGK